MAAGTFRSPRHPSRRYGRRFRRHRRGEHESVLHSLESSAWARLEARNRARLFPSRELSLGRVLRIVVALKDFPVSSFLCVPPHALAAVIWAPRDTDERVRRSRRIVSWHSQAWIGRVVNAHAGSAKRMRSACDCCIANMNVVRTTCDNAKKIVARDFCCFYIRAWLRKAFRE